MAQDTDKPFVVIEFNGERQTFPAEGENAIVEALPVAPPTPEEKAAALAAAKTDKKLAVERRRDQAIDGGFTHDGMRFDSDPKSVRNIEGYVQSATVAEVRGEEWFREFRLADNRMATIDRETMLAVGRTWEKHKEDAYARSWVLKAAIDKARTVEAVEAIQIDAGWPGADV